MCILFFLSKKKLNRLVDELMAENQQKLDKEKIFCDNFPYASDIAPTIGCKN